MTARSIPLKAWFGPVVVLALLAAPALAENPAAPTTRPATRPAPLGAGTHRRELTVDNRLRSYLVHVPPAYDPAKPIPVVVAFHGAMMNAGLMVAFTGLNDKADQAGFVAVYPNGTGLGEISLFFNASAAPAPGGPPDDVAFTAALLDDVASVVRVDPERVYATGMSNGGMMCHRVAAELSNRFAAVAPVAGTLALPEIHADRPVPVIHFHGTADKIVPFDGPTGRTPPTMKFRSVDDTMKAWARFDGCPEKPVVVDLPVIENDGTSAQRITWGRGRAGPRWF